MRAAVRSPWFLQFPAYGACEGGTGSARTCGHGVWRVEVGLRRFSVFFLLPEVFGCLVISGGA